MEQQDPLTLLRFEGLFNQLAKEILGGSGWEVLDAFALTIGRPEGTVDGVHYRGGVSIAIADVFMNMLTNNGTCH